MKSIHLENKKRDILLNGILGSSLVWKKHRATFYRMAGLKIGKDVIVCPHVFMGGGKHIHWRWLFCELSSMD